jgi:hypothetical protein
MSAYLVEIDYTVDGTARTQRPRSIEATDATTAKTIALGNFKARRDGKRVKVQGARIV